MSDGKAGGVEDGYFLEVQSYWPPRVVQRIFLFRSWAVVRGLWTEGSRGVAMGWVSVGEWEKKELFD
jgi:hypothetical protein